MVLQQPPLPLWNSLAIAKLAVSCITPLLVLLLGIWVQRLARRIEELQWANRKIIEKRLAVYDDVAPLLNDILCFFSYVGNWKELTPRQIVDLKRNLDKRMHVAAPLFSSRVLSLYNSFINLCYRLHNDMGTDARLRTSARERRPHTKTPWDSDWDALFVDFDEETYPGEIVKAYHSLMQALAEDLGLGLRAPTTLLAWIDRPRTDSAKPPWYRRLWPRGILSGRADP